MVRTLASALLAGMILAPGAASAQDFTREFQAMPHQYQSQQRHGRQDDWLYQQMVPVSPGGAAAAPGAAPRGQWNRLGNLNTPAGDGRAQPWQPGQNQFRASSRTYGTDTRESNPHYGAVRSLNPPQGSASATQRRAGGGQNRPGSVREVEIPR
ncbi:MAG TPA: hypothetical protein VGE72_14540 [Azospirillum sp.]